MTSIILLVQPVLTVGLAMVLLGERPSLAQLAGVALVVGGIAVATVPLARVRDALRAAPNGGPLGSRLGCRDDRRASGPHRASPLRPTAARQQADAARRAVAAGRWTSPPLLVVPASPRSSGRGSTAARRSPRASGRSSLVLAIDVGVDGPCVVLSLIGARRWRAMGLHAVGRVCYVLIAAGLLRSLLRRASGLLIPLEASRPSWC